MRLYPSTFWGWPQKYDRICISNIFTYGIFSENSYRAIIVHVNFMRSDLKKLTDSRPYYLKNSFRPEFFLEYVVPSASILWGLTSKNWRILLVRTYSSRRIFWFERILSDESVRMTHMALLRYYRRSNSETGLMNRTRICFSRIEGMYRIILCSVVCQVIRVERTVTMASFRCLFRILLACQASITHRTHKTIMSSRCSRPHLLSYGGSW